MTSPKSPTTAAPRPRRPKATTTPPDAKTARPSPDRPIVLAVVAGAHGVGGEVRLKLFTDDLSPYKRFNDGALTLTALRGPVARFAGVTDRTAAEALRGTELTVPRDQLPPLAEGEYYHADLIGLPALSKGGDDLGNVVAVENFGAGDLLEIERPTGKRFMVPVAAVAVDAHVTVDDAFIE